MWGGIRATPSTRTTILAATLFLAIAVTAGAVAGNIDLGKLIAGQSDGAPRIVLIDGRLVNQGAGPAANLEITKPRYRLIGTLPPGEPIAAPPQSFTIQYEWKSGETTRRETRTFNIENNIDGNRAAGSRTHAREKTAIPAISIMATSASADTGDLPPGLAASYDPAAHILTVSASRTIEVRVDGYLLRPISRTDEAGAQYRYAQANLLVLGQDVRRGETTTFEVVFTKPQEYYSIPIYVREPNKPPVYLTVSAVTKPPA